MSYDCNGLRTQKGNIHYYYDSDNNLIAMVNGSNTLFFYYDESGSVTSFSLGGSMYFYVKNLQGDIINIADSNGTILVRYDYDAFGKITAITDTSNVENTGVQNFALLNPLRYRGYVYDDETGLYYLQSRYYDPVTGRFLNADSYTDTESGSPLSTNMFAYCENNSLFSSDPSGCWGKKRHGDLCKSYGFNETVCIWAQKPDDNYQGDGRNSAPFHSRGKGCYPDSLLIAKYLFNKSIALLLQYNQGSKKKLMFRYSSSNGKDCLDPYYLGYLDKKTGKKVINIKKAQNLLNDLNSLRDRKEQSDALLGLCLHVLQDHFAHVIRLNVYYGTKNKLGKHIGEMATTTFSIYYVKSTADFEDDPKQIKWRYTYTELVTKTILDRYKKKSRIKRIDTCNSGCPQKYYFHAKIPNQNFVLIAQASFVVVY